LWLFCWLQVVGICRAKPLKLELLGIFATCLIDPYLLLDCLFPVTFRNLQVVGICRAKPLKLEPLEVLGEGGKGVGPALRQLQKMQVRPAAAAVLCNSHLLVAGVVVCLGVLDCVAAAVGSCWRVWFAEQHPPAPAQHIVAPSLM
jgi:hypothetical protein